LATVPKRYLQREENGVEFVKRGPFGSKRRGGENFIFWGKKELTVFRRNMVDEERGKDSAFGWKRRRGIPTQRSGIRLNQSFIGKMPQKKKRINTTN